MTNDKLYTSLSANTIMSQLTNEFQRTRHITSSPDKHYSLDSEDDFCSGCRNVSHQQQFFSELPSPGRSRYTNHSVLSTLALPVILTLIRFLCTWCTVFIIIALGKWWSVPQLIIASTYIFRATLNTCKAIMKRLNHICHIHFMCSICYSEILFFPSWLS